METIGCPLTSLHLQIDHYLLHLNNHLPEIRVAVSVGNLMRIKVAYQHKTEHIDDRRDALSFVIAWRDAYGRAVNTQRLSASGSARTTSRQGLFESSFSISAGLICLTE